MAASFGADWEASNRAALEAAERAVALDPNDAEAHAVLGHMLGFRGEFDRAKTELDIALRLNPGSFGILTYYLGWASTFGEPERGAEMADRAIRLNPNYKPWASNPLRSAYFMAGRYEDALKVMERLTPDNYNKYAWVERAASFAVLGRKAEAEATVKEALRRYPDLTIESYRQRPGFNDAEHQRHIETMRLAGFPPCAKPEALAKLAKPLRLPECSAEQHETAGETEIKLGDAYRYSAAPFGITLVEAKSGGFCYITPQIYRHPDNDRRLELIRRHSDSECQPPLYCVCHRSCFAHF